MSRPVPQHDSLVDEGYHVDQAPDGFDPDAHH